MKSCHVNSDVNSTNVNLLVELRTYLQVLVELFNVINLFLAGTQTINAANLKTNIMSDNLGSKSGTSTVNN